MQVTSATIPRSGLAIAVLALGLPITALADLSQVTPLAANTALNLDTGATASSGGDILWDGSTITPQGNATAVNVGVGAFNALSGQQVLVFLPGYSKSPIPARDLVVNDAFAVHTNGNHWAKVLVTAKSGTSITLQFTTFGVAGSSSSPPLVTAVLNNSSHIPAGLPSSGIAPSSLFVVQGSNLSDPGDPVLQSSADGLPLTLNGTSITVVVNGVNVRPALWYISPAQIAAVLPANTPIGTGTLTVTAKGATSPAFSIQVVSAALGINTYNFNTGVATDSSTGALLGYTNSGTPGEKITLWATGLGADPADSDTTFTPAPHALNTPLQIYIGSIPATILYQGSSGYPGVTQINLVIPDGVPTGCWISLIAVTGTVVSNGATLPISKTGGVCVDTVTGVTGDKIPPPGTRTLRTGLVALIQNDRAPANGAHVISSGADAAFEKYTGIYSPANSVSPGGCIISDINPVPVGAITGLDVGTITLTGPSGLDVTLGPQPGIKGAFFADLPSGAIPKSGGTYTFKGSGGADVGSFNVSLTFANPLLTWTNPEAAATIDRTKGLQVTWTGGNPGTSVVIGGTSSSMTRPPVLNGYICLVPVEAGQFTVPPYILQALPVGSGGTNLQNNIWTDLKADGIDIGLAGANASFSVASTYR